MKKPSAPSAILTAKLNRPRVARDLVVRPRLLDWLNAGLDQGYLTIVVAPAGFGKTTLVSSWLESLAATHRPGMGLVPAAWLTLNESESDPVAFLRYFIGALRTIFPDAAPRTLALLGARQDPPLDYLAATLSNELERLPADFVLALDDAHLLTNPAVFDILGQWLRAWPRPLHLVLISRLTLPLSLANWRARGLVTELRSRDLRFSESESAEFLAQALGDDIEPATAAALHHQLDGWAAGMRMAILAPGKALGDPATAASAAQIETYLLEEAYTHLPEASRRLLLAAAVPRQFSESLCRALLDGDVAADSIRPSLDYLVDNELFVFALDGRAQWYRLHPLFRDLLHRFLQAGPDPELPGRLHRRAARWYAAHGLRDEALYHAQAAADTDLLREIMLGGLCDVLNNEDRPTVERWLALLPEAAVAADPALLVMRGWGHALRWELAAMHEAANRAAALLDSAESPSDQSALLRGQIAAMRGSVAYQANQIDRAIIECALALELVPEAWHYVRGIAADFMALSLQGSGRLPEAQQFLAGRYEAWPDKTDGYGLRLLLGMTLIALQAGDLDQAQRTAQTMLRLAEQGEMVVIMGWAHYLLGFAHYLRGDLPAAETHYQAAADLRYTTQLIAARSAIIGLANVWQAQGRGPQALGQIDELGQLDLQLYGHEHPATVAARTRLLVAQGDLDRARRSAESLPLVVADAPLLPWVEDVYLARVALLLAGQNRAEIDQALRLLDALAEIATRTHNKRSPVTILAWRALAELARGRVEAARATLISSLGQARRTGHRQVYADLGRPMGQLLGQIAAEPAVAALVREVRAMPTAPSEAANGIAASGVRAATSANSADEAPNERLTRRELEILTLMAEPVSLGYIAEQLYITPATAKRHAINLYEKLGVHSRWEAVARATELGILRSR